ncbi:MAG: AraC family transcriptional regulator [Bacteroidetes bacterium]|nr:AraC family transcriptional regulator [Bacteroidota bacterium]
MSGIHPLNSVALSDKRNLKTLVENRTAYTLEKCELNVFETHAPSFLVPLTFNDFVVTSMLRGKKVMHLFDKNGFDYLPGETVIVPANTTMKIDFPEAQDGNPTQCTALAIEGEHIRRTIHYLNENFPKETDKDGWKLDYSQYHFYNNEEIALLINKLISICTSNNSGKDVFADLAVKELLFRIMQVQNLNHTNDYYINASNTNSLAFIVGYIKENISSSISIDYLSNKAYMSKSSFYRAFKRELGLSPQEYILMEKIRRAKKLLENPKLKIASICSETGFQDVNYFIRLFKKMEGITPHQYRLSIVKPD